MPGDLGKCSSHIRYEVRDDKISCNKTKTISGDLISETKANNNKKRFDLKVLARRVYYTSAPNGPCKRHKGCMLRTANNEYSSLSGQFDVCAAGVVRVLIQYRIARDTKGKRKHNIGEK